MPNGTYGGVRGTETKVGQKTFVSRPTRFVSTRSAFSSTGFATHITTLTTTALRDAHRDGSLPRRGCFLSNRGFPRQRNPRIESKNKPQPWNGCLFPARQNIAARGKSNPSGVVERAGAISPPVPLRGNKRLLKRQPLRGSAHYSHYSH